MRYCTERSDSGHRVVTGRGRPDEALFKIMQVFVDVLSML